MFKIIKRALIWILLLFAIFLSSCGAEKCDVCGVCSHKSIHTVNGRSICENCYYGKRVCHICGVSDFENSENKISLYIPQSDGRLKAVCYNCCLEYDICPGCFKLYSEADYYYNGRKLCYDCYRMFGFYSAPNEYKPENADFPEALKLDGVKLKLCRF